MQSTRNRLVNISQNVKVIFSENVFQTVHAWYFRALLLVYKNFQGRKKCLKCVGRKEDVCASDANTPPLGEIVTVPQLGSSKSMRHPKFESNLRNPNSAIPPFRWKPGDWLCYKCKQHVMTF